LTWPNLLNSKAAACHLPNGVAPKAPRPDGDWNGVVDREVLEVAQERRQALVNRANQPRPVVSSGFTTKASGLVRYRATREVKAALRARQSM